MFERRDVWTLSNENPWHPILEWYARAVRDLQSRDGTTFEDPTCWRYFAEVHGADLPEGNWPAGVKWDECQHGSWYFLPWHRIYLYHFESTLRRRIIALGGPADWALPYWNYSDASNPDALRLPPAFTATTMSDGTANPLRIEERVPELNNGASINPAAVSLQVLTNERRFSVNGAGGFGGPATGWHHDGGIVGALEGVPHGAVHMEVGGVNPPGFMSSFVTAGRDPIFWLHHSNIDRLWQVWLDMAGGRTNPAQGAWLGMKFTIGSGANVTTLQVQDVVDSTAPPLQYRYTKIGVPGMLAASAASSPVKTMSTGAFMEDVPPEMLGATAGPIPLGAQRTHVVVPVTAPHSASAGLLSLNAEPHVYVKVENVTGTRPSAGMYRVYLNLPTTPNAGDHAERQIGEVSTFGVPEASQVGRRHDGSGLTFSFDVSELASRLKAAGEWNEEEVHVTFDPVPDAAGRVHEGDVSAGRVSVYHE